MVRTDPEPWGRECYDEMAASAAISTRAAPDRVRRIGVAHEHRRTRSRREASDAFGEKVLQFSVS